MRTSAGQVRESDIVKQVRSYTIQEAANEIERLSYLGELAKANGFSSVTEAITVARQSRDTCDRLRAVLRDAQKKAYRLLRQLINCQHDAEIAEAKKDQEIDRLRADFATLSRTATAKAEEADRLRAVLRDARTAIEERWGVISSPPHLLEEIRQALGHGTVRR